MLPLNERSQIYLICFLDKIEMENETLIISFRFIDFFSIHKLTTTITIIMQTQAKFCICITNINIKTNINFLLWCTKATINTKSISLA